MTAEENDATSLRNQGVAYMMAQRYSEALDCFTEAIELTAPGSRDYYSSIGNIASVYGYMGNFERSLYYQKQVYDEATRNGDRDIQSEIIINLVGTYCSMGDVENAKKFFTLQTQFPLADLTMSRYYFLYNQALIARLEGKYDIADYYHREAAQHAREQMPARYAVTQYVGLANNGLLAGRTDTALFYAKKAMEIARIDSNMMKMLSAASLLEKIYNSMGDTGKAEMYKKEEKALSDSIFNRMQLDMAQNKLFAHEHRVNEERVDSLNKKINLQSRTILVCVIAVLVLTAFIFFIIRSMRRLRNAQRLLIKRNAELMLAEENSRHLLEDRYSESGAVRKEDSSIYSGGEAVGDDTTAEGRDEIESDGKTLRLESAQVQDLIDKINLAMQDINLISRHDFGLPMLAERVGSNSRYVSFVINDTYGKNFRTFLNEYRIREACRRLSDYEHYGKVTIQTIYKELGYSSPGSFIEAFKRMNGMTPSVYQRLARTVGKDEDESDKL